MKIAYYITGHGYGHAVRSIPVIEKLLSKLPSLQVVICTFAPRWLFSQLPPERILYRHVALEIGVLQADSFSVDIPATLKANQELLSRRRAVQVQEQERAFLVSFGISAVISDITPIAFPAARQAGIPAFAVANFSWDWIYSAWLEPHPEFSPIIQWMRDAYAQADRLFRLPFYGDLQIFSRIEDVGLVCRKSRHDPKEVRRRLGLGNERILLVALRAADLIKVEWSG
ncbi:hypothetical protein JW992_00330, partial [candidate division KSB1 bacterium]|nr:hypothetical protein [candidate division KSB1 bacterium]